MIRIAKEAKTVGKVNATCLDYGYLDKDIRVHGNNTSIT